MSTAQAVINRLRNHDLQELGSGKYKSNAPWRPGANGHSLAVLIEDDEHGTFHDHGHNDSGSLYTLATRLGIDLPRQDVTNSKKAYRDLAEYAAEKGVPESVFAAAGWKLVTHQERPALQFPTGGGLRYRFIDGDPHQSPFKSEYGYKACWYGLDRAIKLATDTKQPLVICNGEPSTLVAQHHGLAACAITNGEGKHMPADCLMTLSQKWNGEIIIALDCDKQGRLGANLFLQDLQNAGCSVKSVDLLLGNKGDIADLCKLHGADVVQVVSTLPTLYDVQLVLPAAPPPDKPLPTLQTLVDQLVTARKQNERKAEKPLSELLDVIQIEVNKAREFNYGDSNKSLDAVMDEHSAWMLAALNEELTGFTSGLNYLDALMGRLEEGQMYTVLAETGMGKTTLAASITSSLLHQSPGFIVPTEGKPVYWLNKVIAAATQIATDKIRGGRLHINQLAHIENMKQLVKIRQTSFFEGRSPKTDEILLSAGKALSNYGAKWAIVDCLSNVSSKSGESLFDRTSAAADMAQELAHMGFTVFCTSQVGRNLAGAKVRIPTLHDGKGSGRIEENSDVVLALYNHNKLVKSGDVEPDKAFPEGTIHVRCIKHRHNGEAEGQGINLPYIGGVGVYDEE